MKIGIACDHGAYAYKEVLKKHLLDKGYEVEDFGCHSPNSVDYPDYAYPCAVSVANKQCDKGIVLCGTGIGVSIVANKVKNIRCALVNRVSEASVTRQHNDSNVLAMGARVIDESTMLEIADTWLNTEFSNDQRHINRICKINEVEGKE